MSKVRSVPKIDVALNIGSVTFQIGIGTVIDQCVFGGKCVEGPLTVAGIQLTTKGHTNAQNTVYDAVPQGHFPESAVACVLDPSSYYTVSSLLLEKEEEDGTKTHVTVPVRAIESIIGDLVSPDGTDIKSVDLSNSETNVSDVISSANGGTIILTEGEVKEELNIAAALTLAGANCGKNQNYKQEV